jgi:hypothetical protein
VAEPAHSGFQNKDKPMAKGNNSQKKEAKKPKKDAPKTAATKESKKK